MKKILGLVFVTIFSIGVVIADNEEHNFESKNSSTQATTNISGVILDKITGEALTGVAVVIDGTNLVSYTDFDGNFEIKGVSFGEHKVNVSYISYGSESMNIDVKYNKTNKLKIEISESGN
jgi:hypothetical protein